MIPPSDETKFGRILSFMPLRQKNIGRSVAAIGRSSDPLSVTFPRVPGTLALAVAHLPDHAPATEIPADHSHDFLVLCLAHRAGGGSIVIDGRSWTVTDGDLFVISAGQVVSFPGLRHDFVRDGWAVYFPADVIRPGGSGAYSSWRAHPLLFPFAGGAGRAQRLRIPAAERDAWVARFEALDAELRGRRDGHAEAALAHLTLLLVAVARLPAVVADELRSQQEPLLAAVFDVIERRYAEPISLADVAAELALTTGHLTTVVRRKTGRTVQQWLNERRMQQARVLLTDTDLTVAAISHRVGYRDVSYFIKRFRADHDMSPARWRAVK
jgi:AraC family transcriptional regulator, transcriptional activator of pobA